MMKATERVLPSANLRKEFVVNGDLVEIATIGNEGMADLSVFLGLKKWDSNGENVL